ncbi:MAG: PQQ-binding-like beta-propeller repeat protein [Odoribacter sp.]|nr:PQQ-binding-like beta-propeller repeat protein [Odoribacter sp.]
MPDVNLTESWTNLLGNPQHIGIAKTAFNDTLCPLWLKNIGSNILMTSPLIYKGNIYIASVDENLKGNSKIVALDANNGEIIWEYFTRNSVKNTIVACQEFIFAQDVGGNLYAVDAKTGKLAWEKKLPVNGLPALIEGLVATDSLLFAGTGSGLSAIEASSGNILWTNTAWKQSEGTTSTWTVANNLLICGSQWSGLYAHHPETGELLWKNDKAGLRHRGASVAIHGHLGYLISESSFFIIDIYTGKIIVRKQLPFKVDVTSTPLLTDNEIIFGSSDSGLIALDNETLEIKWKFQTQPALIYTFPYTRYPSATIETSPVLIGENIYFGASDGNLYAVNKNNGELVWKHTTGSPLFSTVAASGNILVSVDFSGNVYTFISE